MVANGISQACCSALHPRLNHESKMALNRNIPRSGTVPETKKWGPADAGPHRTQTSKGGLFGTRVLGVVHRITLVTESFPVHAATTVVTIEAAESVLFLGDHMIYAPVHLCRGKIILAAIRNAAGFHAETSRFVPVKIAPVAAITKNLGGDEILVLLVVDLLAAMNLEREDLGRFILDVPFGVGETGDLGRINFVAALVRTGRSIVPEIFRDDILAPLEVPLLFVICVLPIFISLFLVAVSSGR